MIEVYHKLDQAQEVEHAGSRVLVRETSKRVALRRMVQWD